MASKYLKDADFVKPLTDADFAEFSTESQNQMPEDLAWYDRAAVKNFGTNPEDSSAYLQKKYPDYKVTHEGNDIFFYKDGKKYALDPNTGAISKDLPYDLLDIPVDVAKGFGTTFASGAAGVAAAPAGGIAAIPAASAAGAGAGAGLELLRQKIGEAIGVNKPTENPIAPNDPSAVKWDAALGALSPFFFGTGATQNQIAKAAAKKGLTGEALKDFAGTQSGVISRLWPKALSKGSGISEASIDTYKENAPAIKALENNPNAVSTMGEEALQDFGKIKQAGKDIGKKIETARAAGSSIPLEASQDVIDTEIRNLEKLAGEQSLTPAQEETLQSLRDLRVNQFGDKTIATPLDSLSIKTSLRNAGETEKNAMVANAAKRASGVLGETEKKAIKELSDLNPQYADVQSLLEKIGPATEDKNTAYNLLRNMGSKSKQGLAEDIANADKKYGTNLVNKAKLAAAFDVFRKTQPFQMGWEQIKRRAPAEAVGAGVGGYAGYKSGGGYPAVTGGAIAGALAGGGAASPQMIRKYLDFLNMAEPASPYLRQGLLPVWNSMTTKGRGGE